MKEQLDVLAEAIARLEAQLVPTIDVRAEGDEAADEEPEQTGFA